MSVCVTSADAVMLAEPVAVGVCVCELVVDSAALRVGDTLGDGVGDGRLGNARPRKTGRPRRRVPFAAPAPPLTSQDVSFVGGSAEMKIPVSYSRFGTSCVTLVNSTHERAAAPLSPVTE